MLPASVDFTEMNGFDSTYSRVRKPAHINHLEINSGEKSDDL